MIHLLTSNKPSPTVHLSDTNSASLTNSNPCTTPNTPTVLAYNHILPTSPLHHACCIFLLFFLSPHSYTLSTNKKIKVPNYIGISLISHTRKLLERMFKAGGGDQIDQKSLRVSCWDKYNRSYCISEQVVSGEELEI